METEANEPTLTYDPELRADYWVQMPSDFLRAGKGFSLAARVLYGILLSYAGRGATAWPGQDKLCEEMDCSDKTLRNALEQLSARGLVEVKRRGQGRPNTYHVRKYTFRTGEFPVQESEEIRNKTRNLSGSRPGRTPVELDSVEFDSGSLLQSLPPTPNGYESVRVGGKEAEVLGDGWGDDGSADASRLASPNPRAGFAPPLEDELADPFGGYANGCPPPAKRTPPPVAPALPADTVKVLSALPGFSDAATMHTAVERAMVRLGYKVKREVRVDAVDGERGGYLDLVCRRGDLTVAMELDDADIREKSLAKLSRAQGAVRVAILRNGAGPVKFHSGVDYVFHAGGRGDYAGPEPTPEPVTKRREDTAQYLARMEREHPEWYHRANRWLASKGPVEAISLARCLRKMERGEWNWGEAGDPETAAERQRKEDEARWEMYREASRRRDEELAQIERNRVTPEKARAIFAAAGFNFDKPRGSAAFC